MDEKLFKKIVDESIEWNIDEIQIANFGEPLLDKNLHKKIEYIKEKNTKTKVVVITNGFLLNKSMSKRLINSGLDDIRISFDGFSKENFEKFRSPLKYDTIYENIKNIIKTKKDMNSDIKITLQAVYDEKIISSQEVRKFKKMVRCG